MSPSPGSLAPQPHWLGVNELAQPLWLKLPTADTRCPMLWTWSMSHECWLNGHGVMQTSIKKCCSWTPCFRVPAGNVALESVKLSLPPPTLDSPLQYYWRQLLLLSRSVVSNSLRSHGLYVACQAPLSVGFSRQEHWSGLPFPSPGDLSNPGIEPTSPAFAGRFFITEPSRKPTLWQALC